MKRIAFAAVAVVVFAVPVSAQTSVWVESRNTLAQASISPQIGASISHTFRPRFGSFAWFQVSETYSQGYLGPTYSPFSWAQIGVGVGVEQTNTPFRFGSFVWVGKNQFSLFVVYEKSKGDYWYNFEGNFGLNSWLGLGGIVQRFAGIGPRMQVKIPKSPVAVWGVPTYDWQTNRWKGIIAARLSF